MKKSMILYLLFFMLPILCFSQSRKKKTGNRISITTTINYFPNTIPYQLSNNFDLERPDRIELDYTTSSSGTFVIVESGPRRTERENNIKIPIPSLGFGMSVQILNEDNLFHEISLTKLTFSKSSYDIFYNFEDTTSQLVREPVTGYEEKSFAFGLRYELGRYFNRSKKAKVRFGLSGAIAPSFYTYKRQPITSRSYPIKARLFAFDIALIPMLSAKLSKTAAIDFKLISSMLLGESGTVTQQNPALSINQQAGSRDFDFPEFNIAFSLGLRYNLNDPKKRKRR